MVTVCVPPTWTSTLLSHCVSWSANDVASEISGCGLATATPPPITTLSKRLHCPPPVNSAGPPPGRAQRVRGVDVLPEVARAADAAAPHDGAPRVKLADAHHHDPPRPHRERLERRPVEGLDGGEAGAPQQVGELAVRVQ